MSRYPVRSISYNSQVANVAIDLERLPQWAESAYVEAIMWQGYIFSIDDNGTNEVEGPADNWPTSVEADETLRADLQAFWESLPATVRLKLTCFTPKWDSTQFAHDYALTRHHHGAGYWDRSAETYGGLNDYLTEWSQTMGEVELYLNTDNEVEVSL